MSTILGLSYNNCPCLYVKGAIDLMTNEEKGIYSSVNAGILDFLKSRENVGTFKQIANADGKLANALEPGAVYVEYYPQQCADIIDTPIDRCSLPTSTNVHTGKKVAKHIADIKVTWSFAINNEATRDKCFGFEEIKNDLIGANKYRVMREVERKLQLAIEPTIAGYKNQISPITSCTNPLPINVIQPSQTLLNPMSLDPASLNLMKQQFTKKKINRPIHYFTSPEGLLATAMANMPLATFNSFGGYDLTKVNPMVHISDDLSDNLSTCAVGDKILAIPTETYQLIQWNAFVGAYEVPFGTRGFFEHTTMDLWGLKWDVQMSREQCLDVFKFEANLGVINNVPSDLGCYDQNALMFLAGCNQNDCSTLIDCQNA